MITRQRFVNSAFFITQIDCFITFENCFEQCKKWPFSLNLKLLTARAVWRFFPFIEKGKKESHIQVQTFLFNWKSFQN